MPWPLPQTLKMKKCKEKPSSFSKSKTGFSRVLGVCPGFRFSVPSALPIKLICDVTQLRQNFGAPPLEISCARHCLKLTIIKARDVANQNLKGLRKGEKLFVRSHCW